MDTFSLSEPFFVVLVKLALLDLLIELYIVSLLQHSKNLIINLSHPFIWIINQFHNPHDNFVF